MNKSKPSPRGSGGTFLDPTLSARSMENWTTRWRRGLAGGKMRGRDRSRRTMRNRWKGAYKRTFEFSGGLAMYRVQNRRRTLRQGTKPETETALESGQRWKGDEARETRDLIRAATLKFPISFGAQCSYGVCRRSPCTPSPARQAGLLGVPRPSVNVVYSM